MSSQENLPTNQNNNATNQTIENSPQFELKMVTGLSGSGISTALQALEDLGYFCVDNLPPQLISKLIDLAKGNVEYQKLAMGLDARNIGDPLKTLDQLKNLSQNGISLKLLFLEASEEVLLRRFSISRRPHPFSKKNLSLKEAIQREKEMMSLLRVGAHQILDTSQLNVHECKKQVQRFAEAEGQERFGLLLMSFGFRNGSPVEADLVWDVRFLPNPHFMPDLKPLSGLDQPVQDFVLGQETTKAFIQKFEELLTLTIPAYQQEGKSYLTIAIGCTGGRHRSVSIIEHLYRFLQKQNYSPSIRHRDIDKPY